MVVLEVCAQNCDLKSIICSFDAKSEGIFPPWLLTPWSYHHHGPDFLTSVLFGKKEFYVSFEKEPSIVDEIFFIIVLCGKIKKMTEFQQIPPPYDEYAFTTFDYLFSSSYLTLSIS